MKCDSKKMVCLLKSIKHGGKKGVKCCLLAFNPFLHTVCYIEIMKIQVGNQIFQKKKCHPETVGKGLQCTPGELQPVKNKIKK